MCGIVGYVGPKPALDVLVPGLEGLEYRGYDSAGVALMTPDGLAVTRTAGRMADLVVELGKTDVKGSIGIGPVGMTVDQSPFFGSTKRTLKSVPRSMPGKKESASQRSAPR